MVRDIKSKQIKNNRATLGSPHETVENTRRVSCRGFRFSLITYLLRSEELKFGRSSGCSIHGSHQIDLIKRFIHKFGAFNRLINFVTWLKSYLSNKSQFVKYGNSESRKSPWTNTVLVVHKWHSGWKGWHIYFSVGGRAVCRRCEDSKDY